jgi:osmotically inducible protein OsmC
LLAAAEAACYSMALSAALEQAGTPATRVETSAACTIEKQAAGFKITTMKLTVRATVPGVDAAKFQSAAQATKEGCPVSAALKGNVALELDAKLV